MNRLLLSIAFLTRFPIRSPSFSPSDLGKSTVFFPIVGLIIGLILAGVWYGLSHIWPHYVVDAFVVVLLIIFTGGLHLDGLMDTFDGISSNRDRNQMLEIMRDSRVGAMGVLAGFSILILKVVLLSALNPVVKIPAIIIFPVFGRLCLVLAITLFPYARESSGLGSAFVKYSKKSYMIWASAESLMISAPLLLWKSLVIFATVFALSVALGAWFSHKLGGLTGDIYGAICELAEVTCLVALLTLQPYS